MTVKVTAKTIQDAEPDLADRCPVALALHQATGRRWMVTKTWAKELATGRRVALPDSARRFIVDYDGGRPVAPFTFQLAA